jgi:hypothetical protein
MAVQSSDFVPISRGGTSYKTTAGEIADLAPATTVIDNLTSSSSVAALSANMGRELKSLIDGLGDIKHVATIAARDGLSGLSASDLVHVDDDGDGKWARYQVIATTDGTGANTTFVKVSDEDALSAGLGATNLGYTAAPTQGTVTNTSGSDAVIPATDGTNAGLFLPSEKTKVGHLTVTAPTDLDAMRGVSHAAVTTVGSATTNPIVVTGQQLSFSIENLATVP